MRTIATVSATIVLVFTHTSSRIAAALVNEDDVVYTGTIPKPTKHSFVRSD